MHVSHFVDFEILAAAILGGLMIHLLYTSIREGAYGKQMLPEDYFELDDVKPRPAEDVNERPADHQQVAEPRDEAGQGEV